MFSLLEALLTPASVQMEPKLPVSPSLGPFPSLGRLPVPPVTPDWPASLMVALTTPCCQVTASPLDPRLAHGGRFSERAESRVMMSPFLLCYLAIFLEPRKLERVRCV